MGMFVYPIFDQAAAISSATSGEFLGAFFEEIDEAAASLDLEGLTSFADNRPIPEDFEGDPDELDEIMGPCCKWFDAAEGQQAMSALAEAIAARPNQFDLSDVHAPIIEELRDLASVLSEASAQGLRFRLELG